MPDIHIFRHAHVDYTPPAQITAHNPLTPLGQEMAQSLAERCDQWELQHLFISTMLRTRQTAAPILARFPALPSTLMDDLREASVEDLADFDGPPAPEDMHQWTSAHWAHANASMWQRVARAWKEIQEMVAERGYERVGLMVHGCVINALVRQFHSEAIELLHTDWIYIDWTAATCLRYGNGQQSMPWFNDACHIDPLREKLAALA